MSFGYFAEHIDNIADVLYYNPSRFMLLNSRYKDRVLKSFHNDEIEKLAKLFYNITTSRHVDRQTILTNPEIELLQRAHKHLGDLEISSVTKSWRIDSFKSS